MSIFLETNHLFLRNPHGGVEDAVGMKQAGFGAIFCNIRDYPPEEWAYVREQAEDAGVVCGPWGRTNQGNNEFSPNLLEYIIAIAEEWGNTPFIVNSESELKASGDDLTEYIANKIKGKDAAISMECWPFADVDWKPLRNYPFLLQIFPQESDNATRPYDCRAKWYEYGVQCVLFTFGSYQGQTPDAFDRLSPYGVYTGDDCGGVFVPWGPKGTFNPCQSGGGGGNGEEEDILAELIGTDHGITAFVDWLQKQPGMPARKPTYNPNDPATWPWPERLERTLNMLREDHDEMVSHPSQ